MMMMMMMMMLAQAIFAAPTQRLPAA